MPKNTITFCFPSPKQLLSYLYMKQDLKWDEDRAEERCRPSRPTVFPVETQCSIWGNTTCGRLQTTAHAEVHQDQRLAWQSRHQVPYHSAWDQLPAWLLVWASYPCRPWQSAMMAQAVTHVGDMGWISCCWLQPSRACEKWISSWDRSLFILPVEL